VGTQRQELKKALSLTTPLPVDAAGNATITYNKGTTELVWLTDKDNKMILCGFVSDTSNQLSIRTTAQALLYYGLGTVFLPDSIKTKYLKNVNQFNGFGEFEKTLEQSFIADPLTLEKGNFAGPLKNLVEALTKNIKVDIQARQVQIIDPGTRSGVQVNEYDFKNIEIVNYYRRRAHAFIYKTAYKDKQGIETIVNDNISDADAAMKDVRINPTSAIRELIGTSADLAMGKGMDFAEQKTDPIELPLTDLESEATYKVRVVGPSGKPNYAALTNTEFDKYHELLTEFFAMDILLPVILDAVGHKSMLGGKDIDLDLLEPFVQKTGAMISSVPAIMNPLKDGEYMKALSEFIFALEGNLAGQAPDLFETLFKSLAGMAEGYTGGGEYFTQKMDNFDAYLAGVKKILGTVDLILKANDYRRLFAHIFSAGEMEEWTVKSKESTIALEPNQTAVVTLTDLPMQVFVKSQITPGTIFEYEWSTSGKYGKIKDTQGHNATSFTSSVDKVTYRSTASASSLSGNNKETIMVTVYIKEPGNRIKVGSDTSVIDIKPVKHVIAPDGLTVTGTKGKGASSVQLYIRRTDGVNDIQSNDVLDYKIEWNTPGKYGKFYGSMTKAVTHENSTWYECLDSDTKEAVENVSGRIYVKNKDQSNWVFLEEAKGTVKINNDPRTKTFVVNVTYTTKILTPSVGNWAAFPTVQFPAEADAKSYKVRLFNFSGTFASPPEGRIYSWDAGKLPPTPYNIYPETFDVKDGNYYMVFGRTWCGGACDESSTATWIANYKKGYGTSPKAEVTIFLK
jgi:hypothetical protein